MIESMRLASSARPAIATALLFAAGCATGAPRTAPGAGKVTVGVTTRGPNVQRLAFNVDIEPADASGSVDADAGIFTAPNVPPGEHVVRLTNVPARCRVEGGAERTIRVAADRSAAVRFAVECK
jgi:hypothetical protein